MQYTELTRGEQAAGIAEGGYVGIGTDGELSFVPASAVGGLPASVTFASASVGPVAAADIKTINTVGIELIAGVANKVIVPVMIAATLTFGTVAFSPGNSQDQFMTATSLYPWGSFDPAFFTSGVDAFQAITTFVSGGTVLADFVGKALILKGDADFSAGDSTITFTIYYYLVTP